MIDFDEAYILDCPCGGAVDVEHERGLWWVQCPKCGHRGCPAQTYSEAISIWNEDTRSYRRLMEENG